MIDRQSVRRETEFRVIAERLLDEHRVAMATFDILSNTGDLEHHPGVIKARTEIANSGYFRLKRIIEQNADALGVESNTVHECIEDRDPEMDASYNKLEGEIIERAVRLLQGRLDELRSGEEAANG